MTPDELIQAYRQLALIYGEATEEGDYKRGNKAQEDLLEIRRELRRPEHEHSRELLLRLLDDESLFVRLSAAIDALELAPKDGERVLAVIATGPPGMVRHEAEMTLNLWRSGEFVVPWWEE
ncbi:MAG: DUF2019 domain-containing protein [Nitrospira sp.]|nr:DUF2019 domain-containing protein [Nitrospira sp.]